MNIRTKIENTAVFQSFPPFKQQLYRKAANMRSLERDYNIASRIGYEQWKQDNNPCDSDDRIIRELIPQS